MLGGVTTVAAAALAVGSSSALGAWAVAATDAPSASIAPYVGSLGGGAIAVAVLAEVTRRLLNGRLIPRETKEIENELNANILVSGQREARAMQVAEDTAHVLERVDNSLRDINNSLRELLAEFTALRRRDAQ